MHIYWMICKLNFYNILSGDYKIFSSKKINFLVLYYIVTLFLNF